MTEKIPCSDFEVLAVLYVVDELEAGARAEVEEHARTCASCAAMLANEMRLREEIFPPEENAGRRDPQPDPMLLARCRHELAGALADLPTVGRSSGWRDWLSPDRWIAEFRRGLVLRPGWTAAALLLAGALGGTAAGALYRAASPSIPGKPAMTVSAAPSLSERELETMGVEGIRVKAQSGGEAPQVEVQLRSNRPMVVEGTLDDAEVRRVLMYVLEHGQKFDEDVRLDSLDVLRTRVNDPRVRAALCDAARRDGDPAVRLKALAALDGAGSDPNVQQTILAALADENSGVRVAAIDALMALTDSPGGALAETMPVPPQALEVLRDRERNDSNSYVRTHSARVLSQLASYGDAGDGGGSR